MLITCLSDTHHRYGDQPYVPESDVLVHCGDFTLRGRVSEVAEFADWMAKLPHKTKLVIAGNHDVSFQSPHADRDYVVGRLTSAGCQYLQDEAAVIDGVKFYGSPWQPEFCNWAFNLPRNGEALTAAWAQIPDDTNVLLTHGPAYGLLDQTATGEHVGCSRLAARLGQLSALRLHVFGHTHHSHGYANVAGVDRVNAAVCNEAYRPANSVFQVHVRA